MSTYTGSAFATKYAAYLIYKGSASAAALNISQPRIGYVYDITEGGTLTPGNITVQQGDAVVYLAQGWTHCNNGGADQAIANLSSQFDELLEEIGETDFSKFALKTELPTVPQNVSAFTNDAGYLTQHQSLANYALKTEIPDVSNFAPYSAIPQNVSQLTNDAHYLTEAVVSNRVRKVDDLAQDTDAADGEIVQLTTDGRFYRFTEPQAEGESGTWTVVNQPADIASNDQILAQNNSGKLTATLGISYNSTNQHLELKGINDAVVAYVDMAVFIKDGMLENVEKYTTPEQGVTVAVPYLKFTFNTDSGKSVIRISFADLIDTFDGSNVDLTSAFVKAAQYSAPAIGDSMDVAIGKLLKGHEDNASAIATKQDALTFDSTPTANSNNPVTSAGIKTALDNVANGGLKLVDLEVYEGTPNEIVKHNGRDTALYKNGYNYKKVGGSAVYPSDTLTYSLVNITPALQADAELFANITDKNFFKTSDTVTIYADNNISAGLYLGDKVNAEVGDTLYVQPNKVYNVTRVDNATYPYEVGYAYSNLTVTRSFQTPIWRNVDGIELISYTNHSDRYKQYPQTETDFPIMLLNGNKLHLGIADEAWIGSSDDVTPPQSWQQWNSQPSSEGAVSDLETRMTAAETAIQGKQATITGAATTITTANLTASKVLGSDANGKVAATSIATTDAEDAVAKRHTQNTDTQIVSGNNKVEVSASGTAVTGNASVSGNFSVSGNLNVTGKETVEEIVNIKSENNFITLRDGAQTAIASGSISGTKVENYDGLGNDLLFGTDASGVFRIGDEGGTLEPIMTRAEAANLADGELLMWDATNQRAVKAVMTPNKVMITNNQGIITTAGAVSTAELAKLDGVSDNIQTQLNTKRVYFGTSDTAASTAIKVITTDADFPTVTVNNEVVPMTGVMICIKPSVDDGTRQEKMQFKVNNCKEFPIIFNGGELTALSPQAYVYSSFTYSVFVFNGTHWVWITRSTYPSFSNLSVADGIAGTSSSQRTVRADYLQQIIHGQIDKFVGTRAMTEDAYWDLVAAGTVQADTLYITFDNDWEE